MPSHVVHHAARFQRWRMKSTTVLDSVRSTASPWRERLARSSSKATDGFEPETVRHAAHRTDPICCSRPNMPAGTRVDTIREPLLVAMEGLHDRRRVDARRRAEGIFTRERIVRIGHDMREIPLACSARDHRDRSRWRREASSSATPDRARRCRHARRYQDVPCTRSAPPRGVDRVRHSQAAIVVSMPVDFTSAPVPSIRRASIDDVRDPVGRRMAHGRR